MLYIKVRHAPPYRTGAYPARRHTSKPDQHTARDKKHAIARTREIAPRYARIDALAR